MRAALAPVDLAFCKARAAIANWIQARGLSAWRADKLVMLRHDVPAAYISAPAPGELGNTLIFVKTAYRDNAGHHLNAVDGDYKSPPYKGHLHDLDNSLKSRQALY